ncbi:MAG: DNA-3-methyladenine glycosylase [Gemmatimonadota bacterium]
MSSGATRRTPLPRAFYARPAEEVARDLLGAFLHTRLDGADTLGRIVEAEAYVGPHDAASHAAERIGRTPRNQAMFGAPGSAYVYCIYGVHWCLNAVTDQTEFPAAVLIRAVEPVAGLAAMRARRARGGRVPADRDLARGPGRLTQAFAITGTLDGHELGAPPLRILAGEPVPERDVAACPRVGISRAVDWPLRFCLRGSPWLSRPVPAAGTRRAPE